MKTALEMLNRLIGLNWEFPDAVYKASIECGVNQTDLEQAYDNQFA